MIPRASSEYEFEFSGQISIGKRGGPLLTYGGFSQCHNVPVDAGARETLLALRYSAPSFMAYLCLTTVTTKKGASTWDRLLLSSVINPMVMRNARLRINGLGSGGAIAPRGLAHLEQPKF